MCTTSAQIWRKYCCPFITHLCIKQTTRCNLFHYNFQLLIFGPSSFWVFAVSKPFLCWYCTLVPRPPVSSFWSLAVDILPYCKWSKLKMGKEDTCILHMGMAKWKKSAMGNFRDVVHHPTQDIQWGRNGTNSLQYCSQRDAVRFAPPHNFLHTKSVQQPDELRESLLVAQHSQH